MLYTLLKHNRNRCCNSSNNLIGCTRLKLSKMSNHQSWYLTNRFQVAVRLFSNRSQMTSKCGKNKKVACEVQPSVSLFCNRSQMMSKCGKNKKWHLRCSRVCHCSVIDHRWCQNVVRTKKWHTRRSRVCHWCSYHILTSSVIYYWTDARQLGIYLFYIIKN